uniref:Transport permease protein n=1 Tax=Nitratidesulfovibrio vulgaris (strain DSM 19637 / Miyazaki F) TaxID=883 RepID=B8DIX9_NITV9
MKCVIRPESDISIVRALREVVAARGTLFILAGKDIRVRYKQSALGLLWVILQPLMTALVYSLVFGVFAKFDAGGDVPYPVFVLSGVLLWQFFSRTLVEGGASLVVNASIIGKIYFPRAILPIVPVLVAAVDFFLSFVIIIGGSFALFDINVSIGLLWVPLVLFVAAFLSVGISFLLAPINALYRDVGIAIPFFVQLCMFVTPVVYPLSVVPDRFVWIFEYNPVATLLGLMRTAVLGVAPPSLRAIAFLCVVTAALFVFGQWVFLKNEGTIVDRM